MSNIIAISTHRYVTADEVETTFHRINGERFGDEFTVTRASGVWFDMTLDWLDEDSPRWQGGFSFQYKTHHTVTSKWPRLDWNEWLWLIWRNEYARRVGGWFLDTDDVAAGTWDPDPSDHPRQLSYRSAWRYKYEITARRLAEFDRHPGRTLEEHMNEFDYLMEGCPPRLHSLLQAHEE